MASTETLIINQSFYDELLSFPPQNERIDSTIGTGVLLTATTPELAVAIGINQSFYDELLSFPPQNERIDLTIGTGVLLTATTPELAVAMYYV